MGGKRGNENWPSAVLSEEDVDRQSRCQSHHFLTGMKRHRHEHEHEHEHEQNKKELKLTFMIKFGKFLERISEKLTERDVEHALADGYETILLSSYPFSFFICFY